MLRRTMNCSMRDAAGLGCPAVNPVPAVAAEAYPAALARPFVLPNGETLMVRPIRAEDAAMHSEMFAKLAPEDIRWRFFSSVRELSPSMLVRLTQIDYAREMAFVAVRRRPDGREEELGVARLIRESADSWPGPDGEFAVIVMPEMKGRGLARHLMQRLIDWARGLGMREIAGQVMSDNIPMLGFVRHLGFAVTASAEDQSVYEARLAL